MNKFLRMSEDRAHRHLACINRAYSRALDTKYPRAVDGFWTHRGLSRVELACLRKIARMNPGNKSLYIIHDEPWSGSL